MDAICRYAESRNMQLVRTYSDGARSGLNIEGRNGLRDLIHDVESGRADYTEVLVYDVSRWGRFQDVDESAYYEYICKRRDVHVHYCAEQFENDGSLSSTLLKTIKRTMAGEYSRELSVKVFAGQCRLIERGFRQGGPAGYAVRPPTEESDKFSFPEVLRSLHPIVHPINSSRADFSLHRSRADTYATAFWVSNRLLIRSQVFQRHLKPQQIDRVTYRINILR